MFWIKKFIQRGLSKQNPLDWMSAIQMTKKPFYQDFERNISFYLKMVLKKEKLMDLPCFINESVLQKSSFSYAYLAENDAAGYVQAWASIAIFTSSEMFIAAAEGNLKVIKALIPLLDDPNAPFESTASDEKRKWYSTPIGVASHDGHLEIIKCLVPFSNNLNPTTIKFSIQIARLFKHYHVVEYFQSLKIFQ